MGYADTRQFTELLPNHHALRHNKKDELRK
jgi:hypothetical protein